MFLMILLSPWMLGLGLQNSKQRQGPALFVWIPSNVEEEVWPGFRSVAFVSELIEEHPAAACDA